MTTTHVIQPGRRIDLAREMVGLDGSDRLARLVEQTGGPPPRIDGFTVGAPELTGDAVVVPKGVWHQITMREPGRLFHITPGPNGDARALAGSAR
jgi:hypothetical protein